MTSRQPWPFCSAGILLSMLIGGCSRDPNARKQKYLAKANSYFAQGQNQQAIIEYENAIQIDPKYAEAHFGLAQSFLKEGDAGHAYQELMRAVEYEPTNWKAQLVLGNLLLAGRQFAAARDRAQTILNSNPGDAQAQALLSTADAAMGDLPKAIGEAQQGVQMDPSRAGLLPDPGATSGAK